MKKIIFPFIALAVCTFILASCGSGGNDLSGVWTAASAKLESTKYDQNMTTIIEGEYARTAFKFGPDNTVELARSGQNQLGVYSIDEANNTLVLNSVEGDAQIWKEEYSIQEQSPTQMTLVQKVDDEGTKAILVMQKSE